VRAEKDAVTERKRFNAKSAKAAKGGGGVRSQPSASFPVHPRPSVSIRVPSHPCALCRLRPNDARKPEGMPPPSPAPWRSLAVLALSPFPFLVAAVPGPFLRALRALGGAAALARPVPKWKDRQPQPMRVLVREVSMRPMIAMGLVALALVGAAAPAWAEEPEERNAALDIDWKDHGKWKHLSRHIATYAIEKILSDPEVEAELRALTGDHYERVRNFRTVSPITTEDSTMGRIQGTGEYQWEIESKFILIDWSRATVQVCISAHDRFYIFSKAPNYKDLPALFVETYYRNEIHDIVKVPPSRPDFIWIK
jgi:hypothetical protein